MERRRPDGMEWPLDEQLRMICDAGFDGAGVRFYDYGDSILVLAVKHRREAYR